MAAPIVQLDDVTVQFGKHVVHREISLHVEPGEIVTILGPSGSGKTIILKLIMGLLQPDAGRVQVFGEDISRAKEEDLLDVRANIGMLFQGAALFDSITVKDNIAYGLRERRVAEPEVERVVTQALAVVDLDGVGNKYPHQLSGGQKKRVGLARALATSPRIVLFDEPTTGLDPTSTRLIDDLIRKLKNERGIASLVVTHDIASAERISDRWILIGGGKVLADGAVQELREKNRFVQRFIRGEWDENIVGATP